MSPKRRRARSGPPDSEREFPRDAPPFFVPHATSRQEAEDVWQATRAFNIQQGFSVNERRIYALEYVHDGRRCVDVVGEPDRYGMEEILAIMDAGNMYVVCTANRGVVRGEPIYTTRDASSIDFPPN